MKLLTEINLHPEIPCEKHKIYRRTRAILLNDKGEIAANHETQYNFHTLIGGGIEPGQTILECLACECMEEAGANIQTVGELGLILQQRNNQGKFVIDYCFVAKVVGELCEPCYTQDEKDHGCKLVWYTPEQAIKVYESELARKFADCPNMPAQRFSDHQYMGTRDLALIKAYLNSEYSKQV